MEETGTLSIWMRDARLGVQRTEGSNVVRGTDLADWLVGKGIVHDRATATAAILRFVDFGIIQREVGPFDTADFDTLDGNYRLQSPPLEQLIISPSTTPAPSLKGSKWMVFLNAKSGGHTAKRLLKQFPGTIPTEMVCDVNRPGEVSRCVLSWSRERDTRVLIGGGDGTARWIMNEFASLTGNGLHGPMFCILPLGVGNDMGIALGWKHLTRCRTPGEIIDEIETKGSTVAVDRWSITIRLSDGGETVSTMSNYVSVGLDADACAVFHRMREKVPALVPFAFIAKMWYALIGGAIATRRKLSQSKHNAIRESVSVKCDGRQIDLPPKVGAVAVMNTPTIFGGAHMWRNGESPSMSDGIVEVVTVRGGGHLTAILIHASKADSIARGSVIEMTLFRGMAVEIDGEAINVPSSAVVTIRHIGQVRAISNATM